MTRWYFMTHKDRQGTTVAYKRVQDVVVHFGEMVLDPQAVMAEMCPLFEVSDLVRVDHQLYLVMEKDPAQLTS